MQLREHFKNAGGGFAAGASLLGITVASTIFLPMMGPATEGAAGFAYIMSTLAGVLAYSHFKGNCSESDGFVRDPSRPVTFYLAAALGLAAAGGTAYWYHGIYNKKPSESSHELIIAPTAQSREPFVYHPPLSPA